MTIIEKLKRKHITVADIASRCTLTSEEIEYALHKLDAGCMNDPNVFYVASVVVGMLEEKI